ncbi:MULTISPECIES: phosphatidylglycerophosphatase A family protein [Aquaspirillum]|uniref:phosphatidylglycerophosphatase A family protein n=1 Tax=Aquaspirillum serpens TaxID=190 RepID=UPI0003B6357A|nr:phosphatidylglycerophosphatase A [Aquaspirillum serpens]
MTISRRADWNFILSHPAYFIAFGFGSGLAPSAPGTAGTLFALPMFAAFLLLGFTQQALAWACIPAFLVGCWICEITGKALGHPDHGGMVWDEMVSMWLLLSFLPTNAMTWSVAFIVFRFFDTIKPWPISWLDRRVKGGIGVMLDDLIAAGFSLLVMTIVLQNDLI